MLTKENLRIKTINKKGDYEVIPYNIKEVQTKWC